MFDSRKNATVFYFFDMPYIAFYRILSHLMFNNSLY